MWGGIKREEEKKRIRAGFISSQAGVKGKKVVLTDFWGKKIESKNTK